MYSLVDLHVCLLSKLFPTVTARVGDRPGVDLPDVPLHIRGSAQLNTTHRTDCLLSPFLCVLVLHMFVKTCLVLRLVVTLITHELPVPVVSDHVGVQVGSSHGYVVALLTVEGDVQMDLILVDFQPGLGISTKFTLCAEISDIVVHGILVVSQLVSAGTGELALGAHVLDVLVDCVYMGLQGFLPGRGVVALLAVVPKTHVLRLGMDAMMCFSGCLVITNSAGVTQTLVSRIDMMFEIRRSFCLKAALLAGIPDTNMLS